MMVGVSGDLCRAIRDRAVVLATHWRIEAMIICNNAFGLRVLSFHRCLRIGLFLAGHM